MWTDDNVSADVWGWIIYYSPLTRLSDFIVGMLAAKIYAGVMVRSQPSVSAWIILAAAPLWCAADILISPISDNPVLTNIRCNFIFSPALGALLPCLCLYSTRLSRVLASRPFLFAGEISYSVYVWSFGVLSMLGPTFQSPAPSSLAFVSSSIRVLVTAGLTTTFAYGSYLVIEAPSRRWIRDVLMRSSNALTSDGRKYHYR